MARRRSWSKGARLAHGLGQGVSDASALLLRDLMQERQSERIATRQMDLQKAQQAGLNRRTAAEKLTDVDAMTLSPEAWQTAYGEMYGEGASDAAEAARPSLTRRLEATVGKRIADATTPEQLGESDMLGQITAADPRATPEDDEPGMRIGGLHPDAYAYVARAEDKAEGLRQAQGEYVEVENADGTTTRRWVPRSEAKGGVQTKPDAKTQGQVAGTVAGTSKETELGISGDDLARQAGREGAAREAGTINARHAHLKQLVDIETQQALARLKALPQEIDIREGAKAIAEARSSALAAAPAIGQLQKRWLDAQPTIAQMTWMSGGMGRASLGAQESIRPTSTLPQNVKDYSDLVDAVRPMLAKAFGQVGNPALAEQEWAKYVPNYSDALNPDAALMKLARLEALLTSQVPLVEAARAKGGMLTAPEIDAIVEPKVESVYEALVEMSGQVGGAQRPMLVPGQEQSSGVDLSDVQLMLTPNGLQPVRRPQ